LLKDHLHGLCLQLVAISSLFFHHVLFAYSSSL
jgi:hypothetical protein